MQEQLETFRNQVRHIAGNPNFIHHQWFAKWHLEVVERLALELCDFYPDADRDLVSAMAWLHDYGKIVDFDNQYMMTGIAGREGMVECGFESEFVAKAVEYVTIMDKKLETDLRKAPIEVQIVSTADGGAHMASPFLYIYWNENFDKTFTGKTLEELMDLTIKKAEKDWQHKIVIPEARPIFQQFYDVLMVQNGRMPEKFFS